MYISKTTPLILRICSQIQYFNISKSSSSFYVIVTLRQYHVFQHAIVQKNWILI